jgi:hypothetical protein
MLHERVSSRLVLFSVLSLAAAWTVAAEQLEVLFGEAQTIRGQLQVLQKFGTHGEGNRSRIMLNDHEIARQVGYSSVRIDAIYPDRNAVRLILLALNTGGTGCPAFYKVLEIHEDGKFTLTEEFGTCWERRATKHPIYKLKQNPVYENGTWRIGLPAAVGGKQGKLDWYAYRDGNVTGLDGASVTSPSSDPHWQVKKRFAAAVPDPKQRQALVDKHGDVQEAYRAWLIEEAKRKVQPE